MKKSILKRNIRLIELASLWALSIISICCFAFVFLPDHVDLNQILLENAASTKIYGGVLLYLFILPTAVVMAAYILAKLLLLLIFKSIDGKKETLYVMLLSSAFIVQISYYAVQYAIGVIV